MKQRFYPDRRFDVERPVRIGIFFVFVPLTSYYKAIVDNPDQVSYAGDADC